MYDSAPQNSQRLFLALTLPEAHRQLLTPALKAVRASDRRARVVQEENLHITVRFFGDTEAGRRAHIEQVLAGLNPNASARPRLTPAGYEWFRGGSDATLVVLYQANSALNEMVLHVNHALTRLDGKRSRPWKPHVTLARRVDAAAVNPAALPPLPDRSFEPIGLTLYQSEFTDRGMRYTPLFEAAI